MKYLKTKEIFLHYFIFKCFFYFPGPIATFLMNHISHRKVALLGAVLSSAGLIAMPFAPNLVYMYGFYGVLSGNKKDTSSYYQVPLSRYLYLILTLSKVDNL